MTTTEPMENQCNAQVTEPGGWHSHRCERKGTLLEFGHWWCRTHAPSMVAAREEARAAKRAASDAPMVERCDTIERLTGVRPYFDRLRGWITFSPADADRLIECLQDWK